MFKELKKINCINKEFENKIKASFMNFPEKGYLNLSVWNFDLYGYNDCEDYHYLINRLSYISSLYFEVSCIKKNKIELKYNNKSYKKAFRINGSRFDTENLFDFLNNKVLKESKEKFYLLDSDSHIQYPIFINEDALEEAKKLSLIAVF